MKEINDFFRKFQESILWRCLLRGEKLRGVVARVDTVVRAVYSKFLKCFGLNTTLGQCCSGAVAAIPVEKTFISDLRTFDVCVYF